MAITSNQKLGKQKQPGFPDCLCEGVYQMNVYLERRSRIELEFLGCYQPAAYTPPGNEGIPAAFSEEVQHARTFSRIHHITG